VVLGDMNSLKPSGPWPDNLGPERASRAWNWKSIRDAGGQLTFGSDWAVAPLDPLRGIWVVTTRVTPTGMRDQKLTIAQAIDGYTAWPAYASFDDHRKGTLAPGMMADVVVLSRDIFAQPPIKADDVVVDATIFDGKILFRRSPQASARGSTAAVEREILELEQKYNAAYAANDLPTYFGYLADDFAQWLPSGRTDKAAYQQSWTRFVNGGGKVLSADISEVQIKVGPSGDTAVASYLLRVKTRSTRGESDETFQETDVLFKRGGAWKIVYLHYSPAPAKK
jgi:ketosteroid isomerase-like protein